MMKKLEEKCATKVYHIRYMEKKSWYYRVTTQYTIMYPS